MKIISKEDFRAFIIALIAKTNWKIIGVKSRESKFAIELLGQD
jgi:hypothetical protein